MIEEETLRLLNAMSEATGLSRNEILNNRKYPISYYRYIIASELKARGYTLTAASQLLGKDHSTLSFGCKSLKAALHNGFGYEKVISDYERFQDLIQNDCTLAGEKRMVERRSKRD